MANVATVKEAVKESLIGSKEPAQFTAQTKARFTAHAVKDPESGELYMGPDQFIDAIAPHDEDYVRFPVLPFPVGRPRGISLQFCHNSTRSSGNSTRSCFPSPTEPTKAR